MKKSKKNLFIYDITITVNLSPPNTNLNPET